MSRSICKTIVFVAIIALPIAVLGQTPTRISGHVLDATGATISNATVTLKSASGENRATGSTNQNGDFELAVADRAAAYELLIEVPGLIPIRKEIVAAGEFVEVPTLVMQAASTTCPIFVDTRIAYNHAQIHSDLTPPQGAKSRPPDEPIRTTMCDLYSHPDQYVGKMVAVRAGVKAADLWMWDLTGECASWMNVMVSLPQQTQPPSDVLLIRDLAFQKLFDSLHAGMNVQATFEGRFEAVFTWHDKTRITIGNPSQRGFGKRHQYDGRLILSRVSDVTARPAPAKR